ncbi:MAG: ribose-phosphate diphosphokinase [Candidatus Aquicultorales bacterium]
MSSALGRKLMIFTGQSFPELGEEVAEHLKMSLGKVKISHFSNGEIYVRYGESVRGADIFVIQTLCQPINDNLIELLILVDALKRASAGRISAVIPHYGYARQDKKTAAREPITAKLVADLLSTAGVNRVLTMDLHAGQIQGFFNVPVDHLTAVPLLAEYFQGRFKELVVVSPDVGRVKTAKKFSDKLGGQLAILHKTRPAHNVAEISQVVGEVEGRVCLMVDDMVDTAGTLVTGAETLVKFGAKEVYACATHGILSGPAIERLQNSPIRELVVTSTMPIPPEKKIGKIKTISIAPLFAQAIKNVHEDQSVSDLFEGENQP